MTRFKLQFRVWHIPQVPGKRIEIEVPTWDEALRLQCALTQYDLFQFNNNIKPDYSNASGIQFYDHTIPDDELEEMELEDRWVDIEDWDDLQSRLEEYAENDLHVYHPLSGDALDAGADAILNTPGDEIGDERNATALAQRVYDVIRIAINDAE